MALTASPWYSGGMLDIEVELNAVIFAVSEETPRVLTVAADRGAAALPTGTLDTVNDLTLDRCLRRWVTEHTGLGIGYVEQLYTFGDRNRHPGERDGGPRVLSIAYLALTREQLPGSGSAWRDVYRFLPWEDRRESGPQVALANPDTEFALAEWIAAGTGGAASSPSSRYARRERARMTFGLAQTTWDPVRVLERYELLYELGTVEEAAEAAPTETSPAFSTADAAAPGSTHQARMALDHRRILATALGRLRGKLTYRPVVFELLPDAFTLLQLQRIVEALNGVRLHKANFRRLVEQGGLVEGTGEYERGVVGRPARLYRFRREVLLERPRPGVGLPPKQP